ncbi:putative DCC family thiol-disulfide oxidoreductase YuxK [Comamonas sp. BIGb0152]|uniref:thiol-disulfide oxidoreductase DCC family protein n=1 Tax=Comamonas sp. BIGb0152 TaxID=2940601 RepID=UPI00216853C8|nr:DUF393 domain-containing protein [Comamonas sp. BIGb0152]MCS4291904.1 putative DCC family thiol-disulfide oxidoreductase YuxK [Comamonas sp. BIGb0152]
MPRRDTAATPFPLTIYYDASCRMCNAEMRHLMLRNHAGKLVFIDASTADLSQAPADKATLMQSIHGVGADGQVYIGVDCLTRAYLGVGWAWVPRLAGLPLVADALDKLYPMLARNRYRLPLAPIAWVLEQGLQCTVRRQAAQAAKRSAACARGSDACDLKQPR